MASIWITGEALIDFIPTDTPHGAGFALRCGGSTYNAAKACARMGAAVQFIGPISGDIFGQKLADDLALHQVGIAYAQRVDLPSTLAFVEYSGQDARYAFFNNQSATQCADMSQCTAPIALGDFVHAGSISLIDAPGADSTADFVLAQHAEVIVSLDPNVRAGIIKDRADWQRRMTQLMARANILKLSDEDLAFLHPGQSYVDFALSEIAAGRQFVAVTLGEKGVFIATQNHQTHAPALAHDIVDTVGAGDCVMGSILADLCQRGIRRPQDLLALGADDLHRLARRAMAAAWLNCTMVGCNPPSRDQVDQIILQG